MSDLVPPPGLDQAAQRANHAVDMEDTTDLNSARRAAVALQHTASLGATAQQHSLTLSMLHALGRVLSSFDTMVPQLRLLQNRWVGLVDGVQEVEDERHAAAATAAQAIEAFDACAARARVSFEAATQRLQGDAYASMQQVDRDLEEGRCRLKRQRDTETWAAIGKGVCTATATGHDAAAPDSAAPDGRSLRSKIALPPSVLLPKRAASEPSRHAPPRSVIDGYVIPPSGPGALAWTAPSPAPSSAVRDSHQAEAQSGRAPRMGRPERCVPFPPLHFPAGGIDPSMFAGDTEWEAAQKQ